MNVFLKFFVKDKQFVKMINQTDKGFELVILSESLLNETLSFINEHEKDNTIGLAWEMKHKNGNFVLYKNCIFSTPMDNLFKKRGEKEPSTCGKKLKVTCSGSDFYSSSDKNNAVFNPSLGMYYSRYAKTDPNKNVKKYKDSKLLERMLKIGELSLYPKKTTNGNGRNGNLNLTCEDYEGFIKTIKIDGN